MFTLRTACFPYSLDYSSAFSDSPPPIPPHPPSTNQPTVRMQSLYVSVATPLNVLCISIVLDKHGGDAEQMRELRSTYLRNNGVYWALLFAGFQALPPPPSTFVSFVFLKYSDNHTYFLPCNIQSCAFYPHSAFMRFAWFSRGTNSYVP